MLIIVRHGRTVANAGGLLQGRVDNPLDDLGRRQADAIAVALGRVDRVVASPLSRAVQTAEPLAAAAGCDLEIDDRWIELDYGVWDERPVADVSEETWARWRSDLHFTAPGGESLAALGSRVRAVCDELLVDAVERDVAVVTHVSPIKAAVAWALGVDDATSWRMHVDQAQISRIVERRGGPALVTFNETSHLAALDEL